jgi:serine phosphatase RsbU (regulator of sigma subunit)
MNKGDILLLYTDGIPEAQNEDGTFYGELRIVNKLLEHCRHTPKEIAQLILEDVQKFNTLTENSDDKTLLVVKRVS